jgi:hypothetical protein
MKCDSQASFWPAPLQVFALVTSPRLRLRQFIIIRIQFPIQLAATKTIHYFPGLSLNKLVFDPDNVKKHGLNIYNIIPHSNKRKIIFINSFPT